MKNQSSLDLVINYIIQHEWENFLEFPSEDHIYFHAISAKYGIDEARKDLDNELKHSEN